MAAYLVTVVAGLVASAWVILRGNNTALAALTPLIVAIGGLAAGMYQLNTQRAARADEQVKERQERATREKAAVREKEQERIRRFDTRFAEVVTAAKARDAGSRAGAAAELISFLREPNAPHFREQTYRFALSYLQLCGPEEPAVTHAFVQVFQLAARQLLLEPDRLAVDFAWAHLPKVDLSDLELAEADLTDTELGRADLTGCCLWRARGERTVLEGASLRRANLDEVVLVGGLRARGADFSFANLTAARFASRGGSAGADLRDASFTGARLQGAILNRADLRSARFEGANLKGTSFFGIRLAGKPTEAGRGPLLDEATCYSILRSHNWREAFWEPDVFAALRALQENTRRAHRLRTSKRKPSDLPAAHYRRHPYPHHRNHPSRSRIVS
ncbi:pentapeptide repeat-containing protein [Amycolatopsis mongoliensis]|uniref:Pentapeptide repeat-containing protein n=1 Tax=Amycolatopsis mongoliensis TaxID=715475 RepID=A0A9Y2NDJ9_9PSEU|nr:pentapeptide repeat-containing protein [Amycolatopsis sp. 4-36]WIY00767.1 pentapeptide repeat-containing protein [Amycolatopsis sp. 4-36]